MLENYALVFYINLESREGIIAPAQIQVFSLPVLLK
jgi:hypothetical protein